MLSVGLDRRATEEGFKAHFGRGTGRYAAELLKQFELLSPANVDWCSLVPVGTSELGASEFEQKFYDLLPYGRQTVEQQLLLPRRIDRQDVDLFHFFAHVDAPSRGKTKTILTILDLIPLKFAEMYKADKPNWRFHFARWLELQAIKRTHGIIAISEATKRDIVELLEFDPSRIIVTPLAASDIFVPRPVAEMEQVMVINRQRFDLDPDVPLALYVGGIDARKNVFFFLEAFAELLENWKQPKKPVFAMAGRLEKDENYGRLLNKIKSLGIQENIRLLGFVSDEDLVPLYQSANAFVFPSLYEGFGLPVLEAMACGVPVVAGNNSSIPEVAGEAATLVADNDRGAWVAALGHLLESREQQIHFTAAGPERAKQFSWERTARETLAAYAHFAGIEAPEYLGSAPMQRQSA